MDVSASCVFICASATAAGFAAGLFARRRATRSAGPPPPVAQESGARFEELVASLTVGVIIVDRRGAITNLNPAASVLFGLGNKSFVGRAVIEAVPSFEIDRRVREALKGNPSRGSVELKGVPQSRMLAVTAIPLAYPSGALLIASDETQLFDLEGSRREFIGNLSHELRTPLSSVKLMVETLLDNDGDKTVRDMFLPRVHDEIDRMVQLVEDLLELARADSGWVKLRFDRIDLSTLARSIIKPFEIRAAQQNVSLSFDGESLEIESDAERIAQVVVNLVDNALRHTPAGGSVRVSVRASGTDACLIVSDTGEGIPFNDLPYIFDRFYVVERSRARTTSGTGLGLSIVKQIVEAHGGGVTVESDFGFGTTFTCRFPVASPQLAELLR